MRGWKWIINERGYANIVPSSSSHSLTSVGNEVAKEDSNNEAVGEHVIWGLVYDLTPSDEAELDSYEGVPFAYEKETLPLQLWRGGESLNGQGTAIDSLVYVDKLRIAESTPRTEYVERMRRGVKEAMEKGIPEAWAKEVIGRFIPLEGL